MATRRHVELLYSWRLAKGVLSQEAIVTSVDKLSANLADFTQVLNSFAKDPIRLSVVSNCTHLHFAHHDLAAFATQTCAF